MSDRTLISASGLSLGPGAGRFDFKLLPSEIVGLAGLDGHGQNEFLRVLAGLDIPYAGSVRVSDSKSLQIITDPRTAFQHGVVYLPQDRKSEGVLPTLSILDNFRILSLDNSSRFGFLNRTRAASSFARYRDELGIVLPSPKAPITSLSGGNQQKVLLARLLEANPRVMLLNDPTRGVDHPTRIALFDTLKNLAQKAGIAVVILSTEIDEIVAHCHRALIFRERTSTLELEGDSLIRDAVLAGMFGVAKFEGRS